MKDSSQVLNDTTQIIFDRIGKLTNLEIRLIIKNLLAASSDASTDFKASPEIEDLKSFWLEGNFHELSESQKLEKFNQTLATFYQKFQSQSDIDLSLLQQSSPLATNLRSHILEENFASVMFSLCQYLEALTTKPKELQELNFNSFLPRTAADIECLAGTATRIDAHLKKLNTSQADGLFLDAFGLTLNQFIDQVKDYIDPAEEVHLLSFLSYCLGVESEQKIAARDQFFKLPIHKIPAHLLNNFLQDYGENFKQNFLQQNAEALTQIVDEDSKIIAEICGKYTQEDLTHVQSEQEKRDGKVSKSDEFKNEVGTDYLDLFSYDDDFVSLLVDLIKIKNFAIKKALPPLAEEFEFLKNQPEKNPQITAAPFSFGEDEKITALLRSKNSDDVLSGLEFLWTFGNLSLPGNNPRQFSRVFKNLKKQNNFYFRHKIPAEFLYKINQIESFSQKIANEATQNQTNINFANHLISGEPTDEIMHLLQNGNSEELRQDLLQIDASPIAQKTYRQLVFRPDALEIFAALAQKLGSNPYKNAPRLPSIFLQNCLALAASVNNFELVDFLINNFPREPAALFNNFLILANAAKFSDLKLFNLLLERGARSFLQVLDKDGNTIAHIAAQFGNDQLIEKLHQLAPEILNQRNSFGENPAIIAAEYKNKNVIEKLLNCGIAITDLCSMNHGSETAISRATQNGDHDLMQFLLQQKPHIGNTVLPNSDGVSPIHYAAKNGDSKMVRLLANYYPQSLGLRNNASLTALHVAAAAGHNEVVKTILEISPLSLYSKSRDAHTALDFAILHEHLEVFKTLLSQPSLFSRPSADFILWDAALKKNLDFVKEALTLGGDLFKPDTSGNAPFHGIIASWPKDKIETLFENHNYPDLANQPKTQSGMSPLRLAIQGDNLGGAEFLLKQGANILEEFEENGERKILILDLANKIASGETSLSYLNLIIAFGKSPEPEKEALYRESLSNVINDLKASDSRIRNSLLWNSAKFNRKEIAQIVVAGNNLQNFAEDYASIIRGAARQNNQVALENLVTWGAEFLGDKLNIDLPDRNGRSALHLAVLNKNINLVQTLLNAGANVNFQDSSGDSALHLAAKNDFTQILETLLSAPNSNAGINAKNNNGKTPLLSAVYRGSQNKLTTLAKTLEISFTNKEDLEGNTEIVNALRNPKYNLPHYCETIKILIKSGADANSQSPSGKTCLDVACLFHNIEIVQALIDCGISPQLLNSANFFRDKSHLTPLHIAAREGDLEIVKILAKALGRKNLDTRDSHNKTALHYAVENYPEIAQHLALLGADIDAKDSNDNSPRGYFSPEFQKSYDTRKRAKKSPPKTTSVNAPVSGIGTPNPATTTDPNQSTQVAANDLRKEGDSVPRNL